MTLTFFCNSYLFCCWVLFCTTQTMPPHSGAAQHTAAIRVQSAVRGNQGRKAALQALWESIEAEEKNRQARQLEQLEQGFELLAQVASERHKFEQQILDRSNHWRTQKGSDAEAASCIQKCFRRHKKYVQMCTWAKPNSQIRAQAVAKGEKLMALTLKLRELLEAEDNAATYRRLSIGGETTHSSTNHRTFERLCHNANAKEEAAGKATEEHHIQWDAMYNIFQEIGLDEHLELADMQLLHDHVGGHYPTLIEFLKQGNVDRAESELHLLLHTVESKQLADLDDVFSFFDKSGNGSISLSEFKLALTNLHFDTQLKDREVETLMKRFTHREDGGVDYSDFLDYFGTGHDFLKAQSTMADIVIFMQQLVATSKHKDQHSVSLSHSMSVHSPLHLNSMLESHRAHTPKFGERNFGSREMHRQANERNESQTNEDSIKWWSDSAATSTRGGDTHRESSSSTNGKEEAGVDVEYAAETTDYRYSESAKDRRQREEETNGMSSVPAPKTPPHVVGVHNQPPEPTNLPAVQYPSSSSISAQHQHQNQHQNVPTLPTSPTSSPTSLELAKQMETLEDRLTAKIERAMRFNEAAKEAREEAGKVAASTATAPISSADIERAVQKSKQEWTLEFDKKWSTQQKASVNNRSGTKKRGKRTNTNKRRSTSMEAENEHSSESTSDGADGDAAWNAAGLASGSGSSGSRRGGYNGKQNDPKEHRDHQDVVEHQKELTTVQHTLNSLKERANKTAAHEQRLDRSFIELQRQITQLEIEHRQLERSQGKSAELFNQVAIPRQKGEEQTRKEINDSMLTVNRVEQVNEKLRKDMERLQEQVRRLELEKRKTSITQQIEDLAKLAYQVVETGGENKDALVSTVVSILGPTSFEKLDKSLDGKRSPLKAALSPISHSNHLEFLASTQAELMDVVRTPRVSKKKAVKKKAQPQLHAAAAGGQVVPDVEELYAQRKNDSAWNSPSMEHKKVAPRYDRQAALGGDGGGDGGGGGGGYRNPTNKRRVVAGTPQPRRVTTKEHNTKYHPPRPSSAGPKRRKKNQSSGRGGRRSGSSRPQKKEGAPPRTAGGTPGVPASRAQIQKLKQRLMRTIVANRLFSVNELNFVFENAIELSPFNRNDMLQMIFELKEELGLSNTLDQNDWVDDEDEYKQQYETPSRRNQSEPGSKTYYHGM